MCMASKVMTSRSSVCLSCDGIRYRKLISMLIVVVVVLVARVLIVTVVVTATAIEVEQLK